jgi:Flp pilus assembly pilin Flp
VDKHMYALLGLFLQLQGELQDRRRGQGFVEYGFIIVFVAVGLAVALGLFKDGLSSMFDHIKGCLDGTC